MQTYVRFVWYVVTFVMGVSFTTAATLLQADSDVPSASVPLLDAPVVGLLFSPLSFEDILNIVGEPHLAETFFLLNAKRTSCTRNILGEFSFNELIARVTHESVKQALASYRDGSSAAFLSVLAIGTQPERSAVLGCCAAMLGAVVNTLAVRSVLDGVVVCMNLIQLYEHVEQLPIENALQAIRFLYLRVCKMLEQLYGKEDGFVGWLKHKWVYLPVVVIIIMLRIAKFYWGGQQQSQFGYYSGLNNSYANQSQANQADDHSFPDYGFATRHEGNAAAVYPAVTVGSA